MHNANDSSRYTRENIESSDQLFPRAALITHKNKTLTDTPDEEDQETHLHL